MRIPASDLLAGSAVGLAIMLAGGEPAPAPEPEPAPPAPEVVTVTEYVTVTEPARPTHPCHEDEAGVVMPQGYYCVPVDILQPDREAADAALRDHGRAAYWPSEYDIEPRNAHDTDPGS